jgi:predicted GNAT family acetyltransferase
LAEESDLKFILVEVFEGARHGHYNPGVLIPAGARGLLVALKSVIQGGTIPQDTEYGTREYRRAELRVYGCNTDDQVGYLLITEKEPGTWDTDIEIYKIGVPENRRGEGHGRRMVELIIAREVVGKTLHARCYPASNIMCKLLQESGFLIVNTKPSGTRELELQNR